MKTILYREVNNKTRYYHIEILKTLFDDYLLLMQYGNIKYNKPTGTIKHYYNNINRAKYEFEIILSKKVRRGYI